MLADLALDNYMCVLGLELRWRLVVLKKCRDLKEGCLMVLFIVKQGEPALGHVFIFNAPNFQ